MSGLWGDDDRLGGRTATGPRSQHGGTCKAELLKLLDINVGELNRIAVVLQRDRSAFGNTRQLSILQDSLIVEDDRETIAFHRNNESIPFPDWLVRLRFGSDPRTHL